MVIKFLTITVSIVTKKIGVVFFKKKVVDTEYYWICLSPAKFPVLR